MPICPYASERRLDTPLCLSLFFRILGGTETLKYKYWPQTSRRLVLDTQAQPLSTSFICLAYSFCANFSSSL